MNSKLYYPSLMEVLKKTVLTLCEVNIQFDSSLEVVGSLHIKSDNQKVAAFMFDEQLIKNMHQREQPIHPNPDLSRLMLTGNLLSNSNPFLISSNNQNLTSVAAAISNSLNAIAASNQNAAAIAASNQNAAAIAASQQNAAVLAASNQNAAALAANSNSAAAVSPEHAISNPATKPGDQISNSASNNQNSARNNKIGQNNTTVKVPHRRKATTPEPIRHVPEEDYYVDTPSPEMNGFSADTHDKIVFPPQGGLQSAAPHLNLIPSNGPNNTSFLPESKTSHEDAIKVSRITPPDIPSPSSLASLLVKQEPMDVKESTACFKSANEDQNNSNNHNEISTDNVLAVSSSESTQASPQQQQEPSADQRRSQEEMLFQRQNWLMGAGMGQTAPMMHGLIGAVPPELMANLPWGSFQMSGDRYQCQFCGLRLKTKSNLESHMNSLHTRDKVYPCQICSRIFYSKGARNIHRLRNHRLKRHKCLHCGERFLVPSELRSHLEKKHKMLSDHASVDLRVARGEMKVSHLVEPDLAHRKEEDEVPVTALPSSVAVWSSPDMATANMSLQNSESYTVLSTEQDMQTNGMEVNSSSSDSQNDGPGGAGDNSDFQEIDMDGGSMKKGQQNDESQNKHQCLDCGILLRSKANLDSHINALHTRINKFPCEPCGKMFYSVGALRIHRLRKHAGGRRHACSHCDAAFALPCELKGHMVRYHPHEAMPPEVDTPGDYAQENHTDAQRDHPLIKADEDQQEKDLQDLMYLAMNMAANNKKE